MNGIIVRALWGGADTSAYALQCATEARQYDQKLALFEQRVIAFGEQCGANLRLCGYSPIVVTDKVPRDYPRNRRMPRKMAATDPHGRWVNGLSMWWRKLHAVRLAWDTEPRPDAIIWLDWDTVIDAPLPRSMFRQLAKGPPFQGRLRQYYRPQVGWRTTHRRQTFHGGCFYCRDRSLMDRVIKIHTEFPVCTDEVPITKMLDEMADEVTGVQDDTSRHRALGYDSDLLYSTRHDVIPSLRPAFFREGKYTALAHHLRLSAVGRP